MTIKLTFSPTAYLALLCGALIGASLAQVDYAKADDAKAEKAAKAKPYPIKACVVSDEKFDSDMKPYTFTYKDQEIKLCCKDCLKDFNKQPEKYMKKIADAKKSDKKSKS